MDVPKALRDQLEGDLGFLAGIRSALSPSPLHAQVFGAVDGLAYLKWFQDRIQAIGMDAADSSGAVAYVLTSEVGTMWVTQYYSSFDHPQIARLQVLLHEARHAEREHHWPHATCPTPFLDADGQPIQSIWTGMPLAGKAACDVLATGSYGSALIWLRNLEARCESCTSKVRLDAGIYAGDARKRITETGAAGLLDQDLRASSVTTSTIPTSVLK